MQENAVVEEVDQIAQPSVDAMRIKDEYLRFVVPADSTDIRDSRPPKREMNQDDMLESAGKQDTEKKRVKQPKQPAPRHHTYSSDAVDLCRRHETCELGDKCKFSHDVKLYLESKGEDIGPVCHVFTTLGHCKCGIRCRYAAGHVDSDKKNISNEALMVEHENDVLNIVAQAMQKQVRSKNMKFERTDLFYVDWNITKKANEEREARELQERRDNREKQEMKLTLDIAPVVSVDSTVAIVDLHDIAVNSSSSFEVVEKIVGVKPEPLSHEAKIERASLDTATLKPANREKKHIDFRGKTYLAPLTTVGNLPFRRICKGYGVDITCGEMALSGNLLAGNQSEWALTRRHKSEDIFGVQVCGSTPALVTKTAELINKTCSVDFIDINFGCPIDLIFKTGAGSAMMDKPNKIVEMLRGMSSVIDCELTLKIRTGIHDAKPTAHKLISRFQDLDVGLVTLHGRSRQQRYSKLANWDYIADVAAISEQVPVFGNGDVMSHQEYYAHLEESNISGVMIGRGALIKPWIFKEIKERKVYDISSSERLDMLRDFGNYGLEQFGSDTMGVNQTRRFMCEWLSYLCRYVPVGLLDVQSSGEKLSGLQKMNDRPAAFVGRNELETLMGSNASSDWVKLSELVLGKAPADFSFTPKYDLDSSS